MRRVGGVVPLSVALLIAAAAVALLAYSNTLNPIDALLGRGAMVTVPDFEGRAQPRAVAEAEDAGLEPRVETAFSLTAPRGTVVRQDPRAGARVREGERITLTVSSGARRVEMPAAVGRPLAEVAPPIEDAGVPVEVTEVASETVPEGVVISQDPGAGVQVTGDDSVKFEVSSGPDPRPIPEILGLSVDAASFELGVAGLALGEITLSADPNAPVGAVISATPAPGSTVEKDATVAMVVSLGPVPVKVPDVVNSTQAAATSELEALGFVVATAGRLVAEGAPGEGAVFQQYPEPDTDLQPGKSVTIVVGRNPPPPPPPRTTTTTTAVPRSTTTTTRAAGGNRD